MIDARAARLIDVTFATIEAGYPRFLDIDLGNHTHVRRAAAARRAMSNAS